MRDNFYVDDAVLSECYTLLLIAYCNYKNGGVSRWEYENQKRACLYDKAYIADISLYRINNPNGFIFADPIKPAAVILSELCEEGAISKYEYEIQKLRLLKT